MQLILSLKKLKITSYVLEKYSGKNSRFDCPNCQKPNTFTRYINPITKEYVSTEVGICNRKIKCGYHYSPKEYFTQNNIPYKTIIPPIDYVPEVVKPPSVMPERLLLRSKKAYAKNNFVQFLDAFVGQRHRIQAVEQYNIGTSKFWPGATVFWQVDQGSKVRTGKIILFDAETGKRVPYHVNWAHKFINDPDFRVSQCLFGEHLIRLFPKKPVVIVESEKSAIIASIFCPQYVWLACGGINQLSLTKCLSLKGKEIILIPDTDAYQEWKELALRLEEGLNQRIQVSDILQTIASAEECQDGWDIADYLIMKRPLTSNKSPFTFLSN